MDDLSGQDAAFLAFETPERPMHVGLLAICEVGPDGGPGRFARELPLALRALPRFRQRLERSGRPRWVEHPDDDAASHVHQLLLRGPEAQQEPVLRETVSRLLARPLDPMRPLWEAWVLSGLDAGRRFAVLVKVHHCLLDGHAGLAVLADLASGSRRRSGGIAPTSSSRSDTAAVETSSADRATGTATPRRVDEQAPRSTRGRRGLQGLWQIIRTILRPTSRTVLNGSRTAALHVSAAHLPTPALRARARTVEGTTNDALLAVVAGALRRWITPFGQRGLRLRAFCPVDVRSRSASGQLGNRLGAWLVDLPVGDESPEARLRGAAAASAAARGGGQADGVELVGRLSGLLPPWVPRLIMALVGRLRVFNVVVTHVRGPERPIELFGSQVHSLTPFAPIFAGQRCSIAALRYGERLEIGITAAWSGDGRTRALARALELEAEALREGVERLVEEQVDVAVA